MLNKISDSDSDSEHADTYDTKFKISDRNEIGDIFHYLFIWPIFQVDRNGLLSKISKYV